VEIWHGAARESVGQSDTAVFKPVSITMLIDSPLIAGDHYRKIELTKPGETRRMSSTW